eukprot:10014170-Lingulodinium_polyedra.AAC.1
MSCVVAVLLVRWVWGVCSGPDVQEFAMAIKMSGHEEEEIEDFASLVVRGLSPGHIHRDFAG